MIRLLLEGYQFQLFRNAPPIWNQWPLLLLPLCAAIAIVYKSIRCKTMHAVPKEAATLFAFILIVMALTAAALAGLVTALR